MRAGVERWPEAKAQSGRERLTIDERVNNVLAILLHQVVDVPEDTTVIISADATRLCLRLMPAYHMFAVRKWKERSYVSCAQSPQAVSVRLAEEFVKVVRASEEVRM